MGDVNASNPGTTAAAGGEPPTNPIDLASVQKVLQESYDRNNARRTPLLAQAKTATEQKAEAAAQVDACVALLKNNAAQLAPLDDELAAILKEAQGFGITLDTGGSQ